MISQVWPIIARPSPVCSQNFALKIKDQGPKNWQVVLPLILNPLFHFTFHVKKIICSCSKSSLLDMNNILLCKEDRVKLMAIKDISNNHVTFHAYWYYALPLNDSMEWMNVFLWHLWWQIRLISPSHTLQNKGYPRAF